MQANVGDRIIVKSHGERFVSTPEQALTFAAEQL